MIRQKFIRTLAILCFGVICALLCRPHPAGAQTVNSSDFTVRAVIPENQIDKSRSYFDLLMTPGQSQTLSVDVLNSGSEEITVDVSLYAASTNHNGLIEYQVSAEPDETLIYPFDTIASTDGEITVAPGGSRRADITVTMPDERFDGDILGGIVFTKREDHADTPGISINNQFSYVIGVKLSETDTVIQPAFRIKSIEPTLLNYRKAVAVNIHNPVALIVKNADISASVYRSGESQPLFSVNKHAVDMAPNSVLPLPVEWEGMDIEAGQYRLALKLTHDGKVWQWNEDFTVNADAARQVNDDALDTAPHTSLLVTWWRSPLLILAVLLLMWIAFLLGRRRRDDARSEGNG